MHRTIACIRNAVLLALILWGLMPQLVSAQTSATQPGQATVAQKLPTRRVVLYKNGVGYFEHVSRVRGQQDVTLNFTSAQLNDVLKSLTILDLGEGRVTGVSYNSETPLGRRLGALRLPLNEQVTVSQFLGMLRGARLEVRSGAGVLAGRLLSVERKTRTNGDKPVETDEISLVTDAGEVRTAELAPTRPESYFFAWRGSSAGLT